MAEPIRIDLPLAAYLDLKNMLTWAALYDAERNSDRNRRVFDNLLPRILPAGPEGTPTPEEREACIAALLDGDNDDC